MNILGALLVILNVVSILGPIAGVALVYQSNLEEMVIPPQLQEIMNGGGSGSDLNGLSLLTGEDVQLPQFVSATANPATRTITIILNFSNPFKTNLNMKSISADIVCSAHGFVLGQASLAQPTILVGKQTTEMTIICQWTIDAETHFSTAHLGSSGVDVDVKGLTINVNDITIQSEESYHIPNLPINTNIAPPTYVSSEPNLATRSVKITFAFINPFNYELNINSASASIICTTHGFSLGQASLAEPLTIPASATSNFNVVCVWTQDAETHFTATHSGANSIDVDVVELTVNVNGITINAPGSYHVPSVPLE